MEGVYRKETVAAKVHGYLWASEARLATEGSVEMQRYSGNDGWEM